MDKSSLLRTRMIAMSFDMNKDHAMPQENDELEFVLKYHIFVQTRTLIYFANYIYRGILFLSIIIDRIIGVKSRIQFVSYTNNYII